MGSSRRIRESLHCMDISLKPGFDVNKLPRLCTTIVDRQRVRYET